MPYASERDRDIQQIELERTPWPVAPNNLFLTSGYLSGVWDLAWDDPAGLSLNSRFTLLGINIYRSFDSEFGPFDRITELPVGSTFWRDQTDNVLIIDEPVTPDKWVIRGIETTEIRGERFVFRTERNPIIQAGSQNVTTSNPTEVRVMVDGVEATILRIDGHSGEIELDASPYHDTILQKRVVPIVPGPTSIVTVSYRYNRNFVRDDLEQRVFYRVTTVGLPATLPSAQANAADLVETPLEHAAATNNQEIEKLDRIWREAVRRNHWILDQGGERVKVFLKKHVGQACPCVSNPDYGQPQNDCKICWGTSFVGGYCGPYDIVIAPDDGERRIAQKDIGRTVEHVYEVWTGPSPLISMRDFIVKIDGSRYSIGPVHRPSNRGMLLQQHFSIGSLDSKDIRYSVPVDNPERFAANLLKSLSDKLQTDSLSIPDERELRGRNLLPGRV